MFHRDQFAHYLRWTHILKESKIGETIVDFGCGKGNLLEVLYRNRFKCKKFIGIDIRKLTIDKANEKYNMVDWAEFLCMDLVKEDSIFQQFQADKVCSFEVAEHIGRQNIDLFLQNFKACGNSTATYYLSTPNYDEKVGAAGNHTYDSGDGRGVAVQEAALLISVDIWQSRQVSSTGGVSPDFTPSPYRMGNTLLARVRGLIAHALDPRSMVG